MDDVVAVGGVLEEVLVGGEVVGGGVGVDVGVDVGVGVGVGVGVVSGVRASGRSSLFGRPSTTGAVCVGPAAPSSSIAA